MKAIIVPALINGAIRAFSKKKGQKIMEKHGVLQKQPSALNVRQAGEEFNLEVAAAYAYRTGVALGVAWAVEKIGIAPELFERIVTIVGG